MNPENLARIPSDLALNRLSTLPVNICISYIDKTSKSLICSRVFVTSKNRAKSGLDFPCGMLYINSIQIESSLEPHFWDRTY